MKRDLSTVAAFHLDLAVLAAVEGFAPEDNGIGSLFLQRFIERRFRDEQIEFHGHCWPQPLNQCSGFWEVSHLPKALITVQASLHELEILELSEIGYWCRDEGFWRSVHPANAKKDFGRHFGLDLDALVESAQQRVTEMGARVRALTAAIQQPGGAQ